jgi:GntR family transcriptional repressor for pyruvate dehydrogenase complex
VDKREIIDLIESRVLLEIGAARVAAQRCTEDDIKNLEEKLSLMQKNLKEKKYSDFVKADYDFHRLLFECTHNKILKNIFDSVFGLLTNTISITIQVPEAGDRAISGHKKILDALKNHDADIAGDYMKLHLADAQHDFESYLKEQDNI